MTEVKYRTNSRVRILDFLKENNGRTVSVKDIANYMTSVNYQVNVTTIYRYLDQLEQNGNLIKYAAEDGHTATFQYVERENQCDEHLHLKCVSCGRIVHLDCHFMDEIKNHMAQEHGFKLQCKNSILYGICSQCQKKNPAKSTD